MKNGIHPDYNLITVKLADGTTFQTHSTMKVKEYASDVDSTNHPFYTGKRQFVDTAGRVEKSRRRPWSVCPPPPDRRQRKDGLAVAVTSRSAYNFRSAGAISGV